MSNTTENGVKGKEVPFGNDMRRCDEEIGFNIIIAVAEKVRNSKDNQSHSEKDKDKTKKIF